MQYTKQKLKNSKQTPQKPKQITPNKIKNKIKSNKINIKQQVQTAK